MAWNFDTFEYVEYDRNPIVSVVAQLQFHPILNLEPAIARFQDKVRGLFPVFGREETRQLQVTLNQDTGQPTVNASEPALRTNYIFQTVDEGYRLRLSLNSLSLETTQHTKREDFTPKIAIAYEAFCSSYVDVVSTRVGLRYINVVDKTVVERDLGEPTLAWCDLIADSFSTVAGGRAAGADSRTYTEITANCDGGRMTARYGLLGEPPTFRLDFDRYQEGRTKPEEVSAIFDGFATDIYASFRMAQGPALQRWMSCDRP